MWPTRRSIVLSVPGAVVSCGFAATAVSGVEGDSPSPEKGSPNVEKLAHFPHQDPVLVKETVGASHGRIARVKELLERSPALANATWDWGFGDWETALGAASHTGNYEIAKLLMAHGARPDLFTYAMMGALDAVKAMVVAQPGIQRTTGPHGITLMAHARSGGDRAAELAAYLASLGDADVKPESRPLTDEEKSVYTGTYSLGPATDDHVLVAVHKKSGLLTIQRGAAGSPRNLLNLGDHVFHPAGVAAVRIRFDVEANRAQRVTVFDSEPVVTATRRDS